MPAEALAITEDAALGGRLRLKQPRHGHRFGHDAILLAAAVTAKPGDRAVELGAGVGAAGLAVMARVPGIDLTLVEIEPGLSALASANIAANGFADSARAVTLDVLAEPGEFTAAGLAPASADHVFMNPPFNTSTHQASPERLRRRAHAGSDETLPIWIRCATRMLRPSGHLTLIWRADGLAEVLAALAEAGLGAIVVRPVHPRSDEPAIRVICRATKGGTGPLSLLPGLALNDGQKPSPAAEAILRQGTNLAMG
jgi:tRNA1(Val) A37 N6-methylase TrmN6